MLHRAASPTGGLPFTRCGMDPSVLCPATFKSLLVPGRIGAMEDDRATLLRRRIELYRDTLRAGVTGKVAIGYLRQIESDEAELVQIRHSKEESLHARGLSADARPPRPLR